MPLKTPYYFLEAFLEGDAYRSIADKRRFSTIDNQMWRVAEIIGDGRIDGWIVQEDVFPNIAVTAGSGIINGFFVNTFDDQFFELSPNSKYYVFAQRRVGTVGAEGPRSSVASVSYTDDGPPDAVLNFSATAVGYFSILLEWNANSENDLDHYDIERSTNGFDFRLIDTASSSEVNYEDNVDEDTTYYYRLYAVDQSGNRSSLSAAVATTGVSNIAPPNPINVEMRQSEFGINITWNRPPTLPFSKLDHYLVSWVKLSSDDSEISSSFQSQIVNRHMYYYRIDGLTTGQRYKVILQTVDSKGRESTGYERSLTPQPSPAPPDPEGLAWTFEESPGGVQINISWAEGDSPYDPAVSYRFKIYVTPENGREAIPIDVPIGFTQEQINLYTYDLVNYFPIQENSLITLRVTALDSSGNESFGTIVKFKTALLSVPRRLRNISSSFDPGTQRITVDWDNWEETSNIRLVILYDDQTDEYVGNLEVIDDRIGRVTRYVLQNVNLDYIYTFYLTPINEDEVEGPTTSFTVSTVVPDLPLPAPPTNIEIQSGDSQNFLRWDQSSTEYTYTYQIYRKTGAVTVDENDWTLLDEIPSTINTFTDYGLQNDQIYSYYITSTDVYGRQSLHLPDGAINLNFVQGMPKESGILTQATNVSVSLLPGNNVFVAWDSLAEEFDSFNIYRSVGNLHSWELVKIVSKDVFSFTDITLPLVDGTTFYYLISKTFNDSDIVVQTSSVSPENSLLLGSLEITDSEISVDVSDRRDIEDMQDPIADYTNIYLLPHRHRDVLDFDPSRIDLSSQISITDWTTVDGKIWVTSADDIFGSSYIVKVNNRIPNVFYSVNPENKQLVFSEPIATLDEFGEITGDAPVIELKILGIEEVTNVLESKRIEGLHARQVAYGEISKYQLPPIGHEGRIRETLLPKRFDLERLSNFQFIIPQASPDSTKTFGDGTTFFAVSESDGQIESLFDFDLYDDGVHVGFQDPSYADDTLENIKSHFTRSSLETIYDVANDYIFDADHIYGSDNNYIFTFNKNTLASVDLYNHALGSARDFTVDKDAQIAYLVRSVSASATFYKVDLATGQTTSIGTMSLSTLHYIVAIEYNTSNQTFYIVDHDDSVFPGVFQLYTLDISTLARTLIGTMTVPPNGPITAMTYDQSNDKMWVVDDRNIGEVNLSTASVSYTAIGTTAVRSGSYDHDSTIGDHKLWVTRISTLLSVRTSDGDTVSSGAISRVAEAIQTAPSDLSFFMNSSDSIPGSDRIRLGDFYSLSTTTYLRFPVNALPDSEISSARIVFTAHASEASSGNNARFKISIIDPNTTSDGLDMEFETIKVASTSGDITWVPNSWALGEQSDTTSADVTSLVQTFVDSGEYSQGNHIIFKIETLSSTTGGHHRTAETFGDNQPQLEIDYVVSRSAVDSDIGGYLSNKSYKISFEFKDNEPTRWVRVTSENSAFKPNPIIDLQKRVRFRILNQNSSVYLALGIREISLGEATVGDDGGIVGPVEWVGVSDLLTDESGNIAPLGTLIPASDEWQEFDLDLTIAGVRSYSNGNGVLSSGYGVLEHLAFTVNPDDDNPTGPFEIYIDEVQQVSDLLVAGTSQGIQLSRDFGSNWTVARLTTTPVHKFYKSQNGYLWAISANEVLISVDPAYWFVVGGLTGVQYIKDIVEDSDRDMYVSTDKGIYWLEVNLLNRFARFRQTQPINAFSTDTYGMYHYYPSSGMDEIWVSTEVGIFKTTDKGQTWADTGMSTSGLPSYQFINISQNSDSEVIISCTRKHILRKLDTDLNFEVIANFEDQFNETDIWKMEFFDGRLYVSTASGVYMNDGGDFGHDDNILFKKVFNTLDRNTFIGVAFGLDTISMGSLGSKLFIGQENRLLTANPDNSIAIKRTWNKEMPSFFVENEELMVGFIYNSFNNVLCFREPQEVNKVVSSAYLPRRKWQAINGGWVFTRPAADVFVYRNGLPTWLDWKLSNDDIISELAGVNSKLENLPELTDFNSLQPDATTYLNSTFDDIAAISAVDADGNSGVTSANIVKFMEDYSRFLKLIIPSLRDRDVDGQRVKLELPSIFLAGISSSQRQSGSRAEILESNEGITADDSTGISVDTTIGEVDFLSAYTNATDPITRDKFTFSKFDKMQITVFNANLDGTGEFSHRELEDVMELVNSGLTANMARALHTNIIKAGIYLEQQHRNLFSTYNVSNIQSKYYSAWTNEWYDVLNSTVDYSAILTMTTTSPSRFVTCSSLFNEDAYFNEKIWVGTDSNIIQYHINDNGTLSLEKIVKPGNVDGLYIWDIYIFRGDTVYIVAENLSQRTTKLYKTIDFGTNWAEEELINLPERFYNFHIIAGNKVSGSENGVFFSDNDFGQWYEASFSNETEESTASAKKKIRNIDQSTFLVIESERNFFRSNSGVDLFYTGKLANNSATVVNDILRFKGLTYAGTDVGLYCDSNSIMSDSIAFGLENIESDLELSVDVQVNALASGENALYAAGANSRIYRYFDSGEGNTWSSYKIEDFGSIHNILVYESSTKHWIYAFSYDRIKVINVTPGEGVFG